jgi:hypothetical protein
MSSDSHFQKIVETSTVSTSKTYRPKSPELWTEQYKLNGVEKIAFATAVSANHGVGPLREGMHLRLISEGSKIGYCDLLDMHGGVTNNEQI